MLTVLEQVPFSNISLPLDNTGIQSSSMNVLTNWIDDCLASHPVCGQRPTPGEPRFARILHVGASGEPTTVKLCPVSQLPTDCKYTTLSHCWGGMAIPCLIQRNVSDYTELIDLLSLPQTYQDAIQLTRRLGLRYLWIYSLCIIQDSHEDWVGQAAVMGEIYQGSHLNITSTKSGDPYGGLFAQRNPAVVSPLQFHLQRFDKDDQPSLYNVRTSSIDA
jgi:Heterokaryon incompatibility protein (HET)